MYGVSRIITTVARDHLLPPYLARVHPRLQTPYIAIIIQGVTTALIALFTGGHWCVLVVSLEAVCFGCAAVEYGILPFVSTLCHFNNTQGAHRCRCLALLLTTPDKTYS